MALDPSPRLLHKRVGMAEGKPFACGLCRRPHAVWKRMHNAQITLQPQRRKTVNAGEIEQTQGSRKAKRDTGVGGQAAEGKSGTISGLAERSKQTWEQGTMPGGFTWQSSDRVDKYLRRYLYKESQTPSEPPEQVLQPYAFKAP